MTQFVATMLDHPQGELFAVGDTEDAAVRRLAAGYFLAVFEGSMADPWGCADKPTAAECFEALSAAYGAAVHKVPSAGWVRV